MRRRATTAEFLHLTIGIWLGIYAFRAFVPVAVWNLSDTLPLALKGALAIAVQTAAVAGAFLPVTRPPRALNRLIWALAASSAGRQLFIADDVVGSALSLISWVLWLWWLAAIARTLPVRHVWLVAPAFAAAFVFQTGMAAAWHGLDLPMATGAGAVISIMAIAAAFVLSARSIGPLTHEEQKGSLVFLAFGIVFFLELTLLASAGRVSALAGVSHVGAVLLIQAGLLAGLLRIAIGPRHRPWLAGTLLVLATIILTANDAPPIVSMAALFVAQIECVVLLIASAPRTTSSAAWPVAAGGFLAFVLVFLFYSMYEMPVLWPLAALALAVSALRTRRTHASRRSFVPLTAVAVLLTLAGTLPRNRPQTAASAAAGLRVATYNVHQGFDAAGVPAMQRISRELRSLDADVIALQEVGRGWDFLGGADLIAYLRASFPGYEVYFAPTMGRLWGVGIMTRVPVTNVETYVFDAPRGTFRYGYAAAQIDGGTTVLSVHLTAGLEGNGGDARTEQINSLIARLAQTRNVIVAGDFNALPDEAPVHHMLAAGFRDAGFEAGLACMRTWPADAPSQRIDYVFVRGSFKTGGGAVRRTTASDHLPVVIEVMR